MASKTVEFLKIDIINSVNRQLEDYQLLQMLFDDIFAQKCVDTGDLQTLDLSPKIVPGDIEPKIMLDIFENEANYLFGRICKQKANSAMIRRDYSTYESDDVFNGSELKKMGIEVFTFFIIDYETGIIAIANAKDAPGPSILNSIFDNYNSNYYLKFTNIPNGEGINVLYNSDKPQLTRLEFDITTPNPEFLQRILGLDEEVIGNIIRDEVFKASIILKPEPYKQLEVDESKVKQAINVLIRKKANYSHLIIRGKSDNFATQDFDLHARFFTYPITVNRFHYKDKKKVEYTAMEISDQFREGLHSAYDHNYELVTELSDRRVLE